MKNKISSFDKFKSSVWTAFAESDLQLLIDNEEFWKVSETTL